MEKLIIFSYLTLGDRVLERPSSNYKEWNRLARNCSLWQTCDDFCRKFVVYV